MQACVHLAALVGGAVLVTTVRGALVAAEEPSHDDALVVTADRRPEEADRSVASVAVVDAREMRDRGHPAHITDLLTGTAGVLVQPFAGGVDGGNTLVRVRGAASNETRVLVDGIPYEDPAATQGTVNPSFLPGAGLGRLELVRGPQSGLYGSGAVGGVLDLVGIRPTPQHRGEARIEGGSYGTARIDAAATGPLGGGGGYAFSAAGLRSDGFSAQTDPDAEGDPRDHERDGLERIGAAGRVEGRLGPADGYVGGFLHRVDQDYDFGGPDDRAAVNELRSWRVAGGGGIDLDRGARIQADVAWTVYDREDPALRSGSFFGFPLVFDRRYDAETGYAVLRGRVDVGAWTLSGGADGERQHARIVDTEGGEVVDRTDHRGGAWAQAAWSPRIAEVSATLRGDAHERADDAVTWRVGAALFTPDRVWTLRGAAATGFRNPSIYELYAASAFIRGNPELDSQRSRSVEAGLRARPLPQVEAEATLFRSVFEDRIEPDFGAGTYRNNDREVEIRGLESALGWSPWREHLALRLAYTFLDSDDGRRRDVPFTPEHALSLAATLRARGGWLRVAWDRAGSMRGSDATTGASIVLDGYDVVGAALGWDWRQLGLHLRVENAFDERYELFDGYTVAGRSAYVGGTLRW